MNNHRLSEEKFFKAFNLSPNPITLSVLRDGTLIDVNRSFIDFTEYGRDELIGRNTLDLNIWTSPAARENFKDTLLRTKQIMGQEFSLRTRSGRIRTGLLSAETIEVAGETCVLTVINDISELRLTGQALRESESRYRSLFENSRDAIIITLPDGSFVDINHAALALFGYTADELRGLNVLALYADPGDRGRFVSEIEKAGSLRDWEVRLKRKDGALRDCLFTFSLRRVEELVEYQGIIRDITERKLMEEALRAMSLVDDLTGLYNRRGFFTMADQHLKIARRLRRGMFCIFIDLDYMKLINDRHGHREGDRALEDTARVLRDTFRESDVIARIGGDEFVVLMMDDMESNPVIIGSRLQEGIEAANRAGGRPFDLSLSVGIAPYPVNSTATIEELVEQADFLMYENKRGKRR